MCVLALGGFRHGNPRNGWHIPHPGDSFLSRREQALEILHGSSLLSVERRFLLATVLNSRIRFRTSRGRGARGAWESPFRPRSIPVFRPVMKRFLASLSVFRIASKWSQWSHPRLAFLRFGPCQTIWPASPGLRFLGRSGGGEPTSGGTRHRTPERSAVGVQSAMFFCADLSALTRGREVCLIS